MPGYHLLQYGSPLPPSPDDPHQAPERIGFLDFLRELSDDEPAIPRFWKVTVVGLEEVLFAAEAEADALAWEIHRRLRRAAPALESRLAMVFVLFRGQLKRGADLWSEYRGRQLPVGHIFGSLPPQLGSDGRNTYFVNFNLTHGG